MTIKLNDIVSKSDWVKISILLVISTGCWVWVWSEYQKPILPDNIDSPAVHRVVEK